MGWILRCRECGTIWILEVSFDISDMDKVYHYCPKCKKNTFHDVLGRSNEAMQRTPYKPQEPGGARG